MTTQLTHTRNSLPEKNRIEIASLLQDRLADSIDLMLQAKQAHWNVKGPHFIALHELFDKVYNNTAAYVDSIAERIVQLGGTAQGTIRAAAKQSSLARNSAACPAIATVAKASLGPGKGCRVKCTRTQQSAAAQRCAADEGLSRRAKCARSSQPGTAHRCGWFAPLVL